MASTLHAHLSSPLKLDLNSHASLSWRRNLARDAVASTSSRSQSSILTAKGKSNAAAITCNAQSAPSAVSLAPGTPVRPTSILVVGATGTLGRQVVRRALDEGYDVRCLVRPRPAPANFLRDWGATIVNADLSKPETIPATLVGIHTVIDCATGRPEEPIKTTGKEKLHLYNVQRRWESKNISSSPSTTVISILKFHLWRSNTAPRSSFVIQASTT